MSKGFINITTSRNGRIDYYARSEECVLYHHSKTDLTTIEDIKKHWSSIESREQLGDKDLGIRGRYDAQVRKNYILSMPNELKPSQCVERVQSIIDKTQIKNCTYSIFVHRGEKDGIRNQHVHLLVNERNTTSNKKDREMISKAWLMKTFRPTYEQEFQNEFHKGKVSVSRERIDVEIYKELKSKAENRKHRLEKIEQEATKEFRNLLKDVKVESIQDAMQSVQEEKKVQQVQQQEEKVYIPKLDYTPKEETKPQIKFSR